MQQIVNDSNKIQPAILRLKSVLPITGMSRSAVYDGVKKSTFPAPIKLGARSVGWLTEETVDESIPETKLSKSTPSPKSKPKGNDEWVWIEEVPLHAIQMVEHWENNFPPNVRNWNGQVVTKLTAYPYRNQHGKISSYVIRYDHPDEEKTPVPYSQ